MEIKSYLIYLVVMVLVTYAIRVIPYVCMKGEVKSRFFKSFLAYIPYTVLASMTFPAILFATSSVISAAVGLVVGVISAYFRQGLLKVAIFSCIAVFVTELLLSLF